MQENTPNNTQQASLDISKRLLPYLWEHKYKVIAALVFLVLARIANIVVPIVLKHIVDNLSDPQVQLFSIAASLVAAYGLLRFSSVIFTEIRNILFAIIRVDLLHKLSLRTLSHLHNLSLRYHLDRKTGALSRDMERGLQSIATFMRNVLFNIVPVLFELSAVLILIGIQFNLLYVLVIVITIFIYGAFTYFITQWRTQFRVQMNDFDSNANTRAVDSLLNYETVKIFGNEEIELARYDDSLKRWAKFAHKSTWTLTLLNVGQGIIIASGLTLLLLMAVDGVYTKQATVGDFVMLNAYMLQLYVPLSFLGSMYRDVNHSLIDMQKLFVILDEHADISETPNARALQFINGDVEFRNVSFAYNNHNKTLDDISFRIGGGKMVAVVGPSGSGKSTLSRLLLRFYDPDHGQILLDGQDSKHITLKSLRQTMATVPQDTILFNDTIGYNIAYSNPHASQADIETSAKLAHIHDFIQSQAEGYNTLVGERGLKLSGGEKQRVAIARAALKKAKILIFDEATSSLDSRSEKAIQYALNDVAKGQTTLVIAHRLSTITHADSIIVLDKGKIAEQGKHDALLAQNGLYAQMWTLQQETD